MSHKKSRSSRSGSSLLAERSISELLAAFKAHGVSKAELEVLCVKAIRGLDAPLHSFHIPPASDSTLLGSALAIWFRDSRFVTKYGSPQPLRPFGAAPSVQHLLQLAGLKTKTREAVKRLIQTKTLKRNKNGLYVPWGRSARMTNLDSYLAEHIAHGVIRLVETAHFNFTKIGKRHPLLHRSAAARQLPAKLKPKFREFVNEQGNDFVTAVDDWLEAHSIPAGKRNSRNAKAAIQAGIYTFAYFDHSRTPIKP